MHRGHERVVVKVRGRVAAAAIAACLAACAAGCRAKPERATLDGFFTQSKLLDRAALAHLATVVFDPKANGIVEQYDITNVVDESDSRKTVTVSARVRMPQAPAPVQKTILLTLARGALNDDPAAAGRWIVTGFIERPGAPTTPRS